MRVGVRKDASVVGSVTGLRGVVRARYLTDTTRPVVNDTTGRFQQAVALQDAVREHWVDSEHLPVGLRTGFQQAVSLQDGVRTTWTDSDRRRQGVRVRYQEAQVLATNVLRAVYQDANKVRRSVTSLYQEALRLPTTPVRARYQDGFRDRRNFTAVRFQQAVPYSAGVSENGGAAVPLIKDWVSRYQEAMKPPIGIWIRPEPPKPDPCYVPVLPAHLVFADLWTGSSNLLFVCDRHDPPGPEPSDPIVVPVQEVYLTINSAVLIRLDNGHIIPTTAMSLSLDTDSWTWSWSASVPGAALASVQHNVHGDPVVVQAIINGTPFNLLVERIGRDRSFNSSQLRVQGRGLAAELDSPYAPELGFNNTQPRTARQLLDDILTYNGVPLDWSVSQFDPIDWTVPAGVFSHTGSYVSALNTVVGSVGAYLQPHNTDRTLSVKMRYPTPAWEWATAAHQYELPAAVTTQEGFDWQDKAVYNRVFVNGQQGGVLGQYTRAGTAGDLLAPSVVDPLITHADAARQRGRTILSDTGRVAMVSLRLPVLASTGIIKPSNVVHYKEGGNTHVGMTRAVSVDVSMPTIYQTLTVETHLEPV